MDILDTYIKEILPSDLVRDKEAARFLVEFTSDFPRESIPVMTTDEYLLAPKGSGREDSFCFRLMYSPLASMGRCYPDIFGIYLKRGNELTLSATFAKRCAGDCELAFSYIKQCIASLLDSADIDDYTGISSNPLNSAFKNILLAVYFPDKYIPAPTTTALEQYCARTGIGTDTKEPMAVRNHAIVEWKNSVTECSNWSSFVLMRFCDWLWRSEKKIDGNSYAQSRTAKIAKEIDHELDELHICGESRDAIVKVRVNQGIFRERLLKRYSKCCLCGVSDPDFLIASHIKPWAVSEAEEKLDTDNGFLMCPNHDKLFDQGYISFDSDGKILISSQLSENDKLFMNVNGGMKITLTERNRCYLAYHRDYIFKK